MTEGVFLTGGTGFVGGAILRHLLDAGRDVRALARSDAARDELSAAGAVVVRGDVFDAQALLSGMRGCTTVFHVAGVNALCPADPELMMRTNVDGAAEVLRAAAAAGVTRFVHTSSAATIGERQGEVATEDSPHRGSFLSRYERSKFLGERRVLNLGDELGIEVVCVNPSSVQGPGRTQGSARILLQSVKRRRAPVVDTWISIVDVDDCARAHVAAAWRGVPGARHLVSGASVTTREAVRLLQRVWGSPRAVLRIPRRVVSVAGWVVGAIPRPSGRAAAMCPELARTLLHGHRYDGSRAARELGITYRPLEETLERTLRWYAREGLIPGPLPLPDPA
jgi:dihydroflavonol-4-reductase